MRQVVAARLAARSEYPKLANVHTYQYSHYLIDAGRRSHL